jgi:hypothetical protein
MPSQVGVRDEAGDAGAGRTVGRVAFTATKDARSSTR